MDNRRTYLVRPAKREEWDEAMALAWKTFMHYVAPDYSQRGQDSFLEFISDTRLHRMFLIGEYHMLVAVDELEHKVIGFVSLRSKSHISLLFVNEKYHHRGVGKSLIDAAAVFVKNDSGANSMTVHSSPYAVDFYIKQGFEITGPQQENDGMLYTPMIMWL